MEKQVKTRIIHIHEIKKGEGKGTGFFAAKSWYIKEYINKK